MKDALNEVKSMINTYEECNSLIFHETSFFTDIFQGFVNYFM